MITPLTILAAMRRHPWRTAIIVAVVLVVGLPVFLLSRPKGPSYVTAVARNGDLIRTVEAVGTTTSDRDLSLQFPTSGIVSRVLVKEGQRVTAGQTLAMLRADDLAAGVASQEANLQYLQAQYRAVIEGTRPEDIAIAQADVDSKRTQLGVAQTVLTNAEESLKASQQKLVVLRQQETVALAGLVQSARSTIQQQLVVAENALAVMDGVLNDTQIADAIYQSTSPEVATELRFARTDAQTRIQDLKLKVASVTDAEDALVIFQDVRTVVSDTANILGKAFTTISNLKESAYFTNTERETNKSTLSTQRSNVQSALSTLDTAYKALQDSSASYATQIAAETSSIVTATGTRDRAKADIATYEASIAVSEAQLKAKQAGSRKSDVDAAAARVRQAEADLARSRAIYENTMISSPVNGIITKVNIKVGEALPVGGAIEMLGDSPYRVELFAAEVDIPKVQIGQRASILLDAFPDKPLDLAVTQIDPAATVVEGSNKYRVLLNFITNDDQVKVGMTGDVTIVTGRRDGVVMVPFRAVIENAQKQKIVRVLEGDTVIERPVMTGMENDTDVEIVSGVGSGSTVILLVK